MRTYSDPKRESDTYALPDVEVFWHDGKSDGQECWQDDDGEDLPAGFYYWYCFPGCVPEGSPRGPYESEDDAIAAMRNDAVIEDDGE